MINPKLDLNKYSKAFKKNKVIRIENFLDKDYADKIYNFYSKEMPRDWWYYSTMPKRPGINEQTDNLRLSNIKHNPEVNSLVSYKSSLANEHFQLGNFSYSFKRTIDNHGKDCPCMECNLKSFLNSKKGIDFINTVTNYGVINSSSLFSSLYEYNDFLSIHHDGPNGKIGFVYNLCPNWKPDWGGLLHTLSQDKTKVINTYVPQFNSLTLFDSSTDTGYPHYVSHVVNKNVQRFSMAGWYK